jgi:predicted phosphodiesterase
LKGTAPAKLAKIGVLGDIHAEDASLDVALRFLEDAGVDQVMSVGDIVDGPGSVDRCCERLGRAGVLAVKGNHERWFLAGTMRDLPDATRSLGAEARAFLSALPRTRRFDTAAGPVLLCHGLGEDDMASVAAEDDERTMQWWSPALASMVHADVPEIVINGHTHRRLMWSFRRVTVINAGTLYREHQPCFMIADLVEREVTWFDLDADHRIIGQKRLPIPLSRGQRSR